MSETTLAYYPGCMGLDCAREMDRSLRALLEALEIPTREIPDWNCCGGPVADSVDPSLAKRLSARVLDLVPQGCEILCACPVCFRRLKVAQPDAPVRSVLDLLTRQEVLQRVRKKSREKLHGLKAACYTGPQDGPSERETLELLVQTSGVQMVKWPSRKAPHGGTSTFTEPALMQRLAGKILTDAIDAGADFIVLTDPHAQFNLDCFQYPIGRELHRAVEIPVLFVSELLCHLLGLASTESHYARHVTPPFGLFLDYYDRQQAVMEKT